MAQTYTRQSSFADGDTITAALFNNEFNQLVNAFAYSSSSATSTGHRHDGTAGQGGNIHTIGDLDFLNKIVIDSTNNRWGFYVEVSSSAVEQIRLQDGALLPVTDSDIDLGTTSLRFKDTYTDSLTTTGNVAVGGNLTVTGTTTFNGGTITMGDAATDNVVFGADVDSNIIPDDDDSYDLGSSSQQWRNIFIDGTAEIDTLALNGTTVTSTAAELNILDGVTSTAAELNILDGVTASATDINLIDGITNGTVIASKAIITDSNKDITGGRNITISGELDAGSLDVSGDVDVDGTLETDALSINGTAVTSTAAELNILDGKAFLDEDNMASNSATGIASQQSIKAYVDTTVAATNEVVEDTSPQLGGTLDTNGNLIQFGDSSGATDDRLQFGGSQDLSIYHDGTHSYAANSTGSFYLRTASSLQIENSDGSEDLATFAVNGAATLFHDNSAKLATTSTGIDVTGGIDVNGFGKFNSNSAEGVQIGGDSGGSTHIGNLLNSSGVLTLQSAGTRNLLIDAGGDITLDADGGDIYLEDGGTRFGYFTNSSTDLFIGVNAQDKDIYFKGSDGGSGITALRLDMSEAGTAHFNHDIRLPDSGKAIFGAGSDLQIYHDGSNSFIQDAGTGQIRILGDDVRIMNAAGTEISAQFIQDGEARLKFDNATKLATKTDGIDVTGTVTADGLSVEISDNNSSPVTIQQGGNSYFKIVTTNSSESVQIGNSTTKPNVLLGQGNVGIGSDSPDAPLTIHNSSDPEIRFGYNSSQDHKISWDSSKLFIEADPENANGSSAIGFRVDGSEVGRFTPTGLGIGTSSPDVSLDLGSNTDSIHVPVGTSAQRPGSPAAGYFRYNSETARFEGYTDQWSSIAGSGSGTNMDTNTFTGDGSDTTFTLSNAPDEENNLMVFIDGVFQAHNVYSISGTTLTFATAPASGRLITVYHSTTTVGGSNNTIATMTGDGSDTTLTLPTVPVHENNVSVYLNGVYQSKSTYSVSGSTLTFSSAPSNGVLVEAITSTNTSITTATQLVDADSDTMIQVEESSDEDKIRFDTGGTQRAVIDSTGLDVTGTTETDVLTINGSALKYKAFGTSSIMFGDDATGTIDAANYNTGLGVDVFAALTTGDNNTAVGYASLSANTTGTDNTAVGFGALDAVSTSSFNTAVGKNAAGATTGEGNTAVGREALSANSSGANNTAIGKGSLQSNTTASNNVALGKNSLFQNTTGTENTSIGDSSSDANTTGSYNTALGRNALGANTTANHNTAVGRLSLFTNSTGASNTAVGSGALQSNTTASNNTAVGADALVTNTTGTDNVAVGNQALNANTTASNNTAVGDVALSNNTEGFSNTAVGATAMLGNTTGDQNTAIGANALDANTTADNNTAVGNAALGANTTGDRNVALGSEALDANTTADGNTAVGYAALSANTTSELSTGVGFKALRLNTGANNTGVGALALDANTTGTENVAVGVSALDACTTGSYNVGMGINALGALTTASFNTGIGTGVMVSITTGNHNTGIGYTTLDHTTTGTNNVAVGNYALTANTTASDNTAVGYLALSANTTGTKNTALGKDAALAITTGNQNTALGARSLQATTTADHNTAIGEATLYANTTGASNTGVGSQALAANTTGSSNTAVGKGALDANTTGSNNIAIGLSSLGVNVNGGANVSIGNFALDANTSANNNTAVGYASLSANTTGSSNVALGRLALTANTTASLNTAIGAEALDTNTTGGSNTAIGYAALYANTTASNNTAVGVNSLKANTTGSTNTAVGGSSLFNNTTGSRNQAFGYNSLNANTTGVDNIAMGENSLLSNTTGGFNIAIGNFALDANTTASSNTAIGYGSLTANTTGASNTALGTNSLDANTTAHNNTAIGYDALTANTTGTQNTAVGKDAGKAITTGSNNTCLGYQAGEAITTGGDNVVLGQFCETSAVDVSNEVIVGSNLTGKGDDTAFIGGQNGAFNEANSSTWSTTSDKRIKKNIVDNNIGLEKLNQIQVRNFEYRTKDEITEVTDKAVVDISGVQIGVIAQEIENIFPDVVTEKTTGVKIVNTENLTWYLINAVKELSAKVDELQQQLNSKGE